MLHCGSVAQECFIYFHLKCLIELCQQIHMRVSEVKIVKHANSDHSQISMELHFLRFFSECIAHSLTIFQYHLIKLLKNG